ncbi:hypothetical protein [Oleiagrimonas soli]|uniref:Uncharacterized protein n=1 Tax=Oleiagrimonas soli TaxID=1543381 RepID=A0A099CWM9_9GAMM|nr:hypothetical protein [Oleiagrimonas soli]KGI78056.1 hypothetical protein LF63_0106710 [Oleiagrimonas soli]MBB6183542.1 hypothetical protein [Oleiagrimonas soli]
MTEAENEARLQELYDIAGRLMELAREDQDAMRVEMHRVQALCLSLSKAHAKQLSHWDQTLRKTFVEVAESSVEPTRRAMEQARKDAEFAAYSYRHALRRLGWGRFLFACAISVALWLAVLVSVWVFVPSLDQLAARRAEVANLRAQAEQMSARAKAEFTQCEDRDGTQHLCFRDDESKGPYFDGNKTYRALWRH